MPSSEKRMSLHISIRETEIFFSGLNNITFDLPIIERLAAHSRGRRVLERNGRKHPVCVGWWQAGMGATDEGLITHLLYSLWVHRLRSCTFVLQTQKSP